MLPKDALVRNYFFQKFAGEHINTKSIKNQEREKKRNRLKSLTCQLIRLCVDIKKLKSLWIKGHFFYNKEIVVNVLLLLNNIRSELEIITKLHLKAISDTEKVPSQNSKTNDGPPVSSNIFLRLPYLDIVACRKHLLKKQVLRKNFFPPLIFLQKTS